MTGALSALIRVNHRPDLDGRGGCERQTLSP